MRRRIPHSLIFIRSVEIAARQDDDRGTWWALHLGGHRFKRLDYGYVTFQAGIVAMGQEVRGGSDVVRAFGVGWEVCRRMRRLHRGWDRSTPLDIEYMLLAVEFP